MKALVAAHCSRSLKQALQMQDRDALLGWIELSTVVERAEPADAILVEVAQAAPELVAAAQDAPALFATPWVLLDRPDVPLDPRRPHHILPPDAGPKAVFTELLAVLGLAPNDSTQAASAPPRAALRSRPAPLLPETRSVSTATADAGARRPTLPAALQGTPGLDLTGRNSQLSPALRKLLHAAEEEIANAETPGSLRPTPPAPQPKPFALTPEVAEALALAIDRHDNVAPDASDNALKSSPPSAPAPAFSDLKREEPASAVPLPTSEAATHTSAPPQVDSLEQSRVALTARPPAATQPGRFDASETRPAANSAPSEPVLRDTTGIESRPTRPPRAGGRRISTQSDEPGSDSGELITARPPPSPSGAETFGVPRAPSLPAELRAAAEQASRVLDETTATGLSLPEADLDEPARATQTDSPTSVSDEARITRLVGQGGDTQAASGEGLSLHDDVGLSTLGRAIRSRQTGMLEYESAGIVRRIVLREGDFVTAVSSAHEESLVAFLVAHAQLDERAAEPLSHRLPSFGRHAGAALIAGGYLAQKELWPTLRRHAEFIVLEVLRLTEGVVAFEHNVPERLGAEPSVFGGDTGSEVFVELLKRLLPPMEAMARLGGDNTQLGTGSSIALLDECGLSAEEADAVHFTTSTTVGQSTSVCQIPALPCTLYALVLLGVLETVRPAALVPDLVLDSDQQMDLDALRRSIALRRRLVDDADYFTLLGVPRDVTSYDLHRAYQELRQDLDPGRALTVGTLDLKDDLQLIHEVLNEAYEVLSDATKRNRYRRALESAPLAP